MPRRRPSRPRSRRRHATLLLALVVAALAAWWGTAEVREGVRSGRHPVSAADLGRARASLAGLEVKGRAPLTGYARDEFGAAWADVDGNGCDTRNDVLARDLAEVVRDTGGCIVRSGVLDDPYTGQAIAFARGPGSSGDVQIDHVVALADAWQKGAQAWSADRRRQFANDPANLLAVDGEANQAKGAGDAATWLPPERGYRCAYVLRQVGVKAAYGLWVTAAERDAMARWLDECVVVTAP